MEPLLAVTLQKKLHSVELKHYTLRNKAGQSPKLTAAKGLLVRDFRSLLLIRSKSGGDFLAKQMVPLKVGLLIRGRDS